ncbi:MAG: glycerol kinase GlpK [Alphaproteobacteria bacterium]|nr:glycerol kinase GlpK [Alphaproteobacteria bacterium]
MAASTPLFLSIDQGTTSTRAIVFDLAGAVKGVAQRELPQIYPQDGWVEHDAEEIWQATVAVCRGALRDQPQGAVSAIGITNQRETTVVWDRKTGRPLANAIVWQDRRTAPMCDALRRAGREPILQARTGLLADSYFSGTKLAWLLDQVPDARARARDGALCFGTIDSWLIFKLTGGRRHVTDATNASRTLLFNIDKQDWDDEILSWFEIPRAMLPEVKDSAADFGEADSELFGRALPIRGVAGDQQAAIVGQACFQPGLMKSTYGTGCFALVNTGETHVASANKLVSTIAYRVNGQATYAVEGSIFMAGAIVQWLRDGLKVIARASETADLAARADPRSRVMLVPAFTGLGAPYWDPNARGAILGLTRDAGVPEIARAALESVSFQTRDLVDAMARDMDAAGLTAPAALRVDGGMVVNDWFCQNLADLLGRPIERPENTETTAFGAALLAALGSGAVRSLDEAGALWRSARRFEPLLGQAERDARYDLWKESVSRVLTSGPGAV